jgi:hypothetical protein
VTCVVHHGSTYDAVFGYESDNLADETVPTGEGNTFTPAPAQRGQPTVFMPGRFEQAVTVTGIPASAELTWTLAFDGTRTATATASASNCAGAPKPPEPPGPLPPEPPRPLGIFAACVLNHGRTYDATFGYVNDNVGDVVIPVGSHNTVSPGRAGQAQPETFRSGFVDAAFTVRGVSAATPISWRLTFGHQVRVATATATLPDKCVTAPIDPIADLAAATSVTPPTATVGDDVVFTIVARDNGSDMLGPATVMNSLPASQLKILSVTTTLGTCRAVGIAGSRRIDCSARTLAPGESFTIRIRARAIRPGSATDRAKIVGLPNDPTPDDNAAQATVDIRQPAPPPPRVTG